MFAMAQGLASPNPGERDLPLQAPPFAVDPTAPHIREFVLRNLLRGTIRVIPGTRGKLLILATGDFPRQGRLTRAGGEWSHESPRRPDRGGASRPLRG